MSRVVTTLLTGPLDASLCSLLCRPAAGLQDAGCPWSQTKHDPFPTAGGFHNTENADMGPPPNAPPAPIWPSPGGSHPQPGHVLSRSGSGPRSEAEAARQQPEAGERTLLAAVHLTKPGRPKPYQAQVVRGGKQWQQAAARRPAGKPPLTSEEARQQARAEGLTLLVTNSKYNSKTGYFGVSQKGPERAKPFHAQVTRDGRTTTLGSFSTAEEAALCIARSPDSMWKR